MIDESKVNDPEYMKKELKTNNPHIIQLLGQDLRNDPNFILEVLKMENFRYNFAIIGALGDNLKTNIDFLVACAEVLKSKGVIREDNFYKFTKRLSHNFIENNEEFWQAMNKAGITHKENIRTVNGLDYNSPEYYKDRKQKRQGTVLENIGNITSKEFLKITNESDRGEPKFMLEVITKNPSLYIHMSNKLKKNKNFMKLAISGNPQIEEVVQEETRKKEEETRKKVEENEKRRQERMKQNEEQKQKQERENVEKIKQEYNKQGENHPRLILVNEFLANNTSRKLFCKANDINEQELEEALKEVSEVYPEYKQKIADKNRQISAIHLNTVESINKKLISGEMTLVQYSRENNPNIRINELLKGLKNAEDRKSLQKLIINEMASGNLKMMDYVRLFSEQYSYKTVINSVNSFIKQVQREIPELQGRGKPINLAQIQVRELKKFEKQYKKSDFIGLTIGFKDNNDEMKMVTIDSEHIDYAKKYLQLEDEYICYSTMNKAISSLAKGEITKEEIDERIEKKKAFLELKKKARKKQELTEKAVQTGMKMEVAQALKKEYEEKMPSTDEEHPGGTGDNR